MTYVLVNFKDPVLAKLEVRRALDAAIDRQTIIEHKLFGMAKPATSLLTPINPYYHAGLKGYSGPLAPPPEDEFELKTSNAPQAVASGVVIANQLRKAGFRVRQQSYEWSTFYADVRQGRFQLATMRWVGTVDPDLYRMAFHSREVPPGRNRGSYVNPELDRLLDRAAETADPKLRHELMRQVQEKVHRDLAILPLWYDDQIAIATSLVKDYVPETSGGFLAFARARKEKGPESP